MMSLETVLLAFPQHVLETRIFEGLFWLKLSAPGVDTALAEGRGGTFAESSTILCANVKRYIQGKGTDLEHYAAVLALP